MSADASPLTIGALAAQTACNVASIRYYEEIGLMPKARAGAPAGTAFIGNPTCGAFSHPTMPRL